MLKRSTPLRRSSGEARLTVKVFKPKTCKQCRERFTPTREMQPVCPPPKPCAYEYGMKAASKNADARAKAERRADKAKREKLKTRSDYIKEAQVAFNKYIRLRDAGKPCICCSHPLGTGEVGGAYDCGHYRSVGSAPHLRFDERNAHAQRKQCNKYGAGRAVDYRIGLISRIGRASVEALESDQSPKHYSIEDLKAIRDKYRALARQLEKKE